VEQSRRMAYRDWGDSVTSGKSKIKSVFDITIIKDSMTAEIVEYRDGVVVKSWEEPVHDAENQEVRKWHCAECMEVLTSEEVKWWYDNTPRCCSGYLCGCRGLPVDPPYCEKCMEGADE
jgi:hypothetical protein